MAHLGAAAYLVNNNPEPAVTPMRQTDMRHKNAQGHQFPHVVFFWCLQKDSYRSEIEDPSGSIYGWRRYCHTNSISSEG